MKRKSLFVVLLILLAFFSVLTFTACNQNDNSQQTQEEQKKEEEEHVHDWQKGMSVPGNCRTYGYTPYQCSICNEVKREYDTVYGDHSYSGHVCSFCGAREAGAFGWACGSARAYLYIVSSDLDGSNATYWLVIDGSSASEMATYDKASDRPWNEYSSSIVRAEVTSNVSNICDYFADGFVNLVDLKIASSVRSIGKYAFNNCHGLTSLNAGGGVREVGDYAFKNCNAMTECVLSKECAKIGKSVFSGCTSLKTVSIGVSGSDAADETRFFGSYFSENLSSEGCTQNVTYEGKTYGFAIPKTLTKVNILGEGVISSYAFYGCDFIEEITISGEVKVIEDHAFAAMSKLAEFIIISNSLTDIGQYAFKNDGLLGGKKIYYDDDGNVFERERFLTLPSSLQTIGIGAYAGCGQMEIMYLDSTRLTEISTDAFSGCSNLRIVTLPETLVVIHNRAFSNTKLEELHIPENVNTVAKGAFEGRAAMKNLYIDSENLYYSAWDDNSCLFEKVEYVWVKDTAVTDNPAEEDDSQYIKKNFKYLSLDPNGYHGWVRK